MSPTPLADLGSSLSHFFHGVDAFFSNLAGIDWGAFAIALLFYLGMLIARTRGWFNTVRAAYPNTRIPYTRIAAAYLAGAGVNAIVPARGGDVLKVFLAKNQIPDSSYPTVASSFAIESVFDMSAGILVLIYALTQGLLPKPPDLPSLPAFEISFWAAHPRFLLFFLTLLGLGAIIGFVLLVDRAEVFWRRLKQGVVILTDRRRYLRQVASWQGLAWLCRFGSFWFFLEAFHIGGSVSNVLLVMSVQAISTLLPFTPGGAGAQQALLVASLAGASKADVLAYSVGQQIAIAAWAAIIGFGALFLVFRTTNWRQLVAEGKAAQAEAKRAEAPV
jgi:uncharacterized membrane protein YbhN (UPF0104 family)